jgi:lipopolysaccharide assembly protein A
MKYHHYRYFILWSIALVAIPAVLCRIWRRKIMYFSLIITFLLLLGLVITSLQNSMPLELKFITWNLQMSSTALILYSALIGGAIVAVLAVPKLVRKTFDVRRLNKEIYKLKEKILESEKGHVGGA